MDSVTLKEQKVKFINSVTQYNEKYSEILKQVNQINALLDESDDNLLYDYIRKSYDKLKEKINELLSDVDKYKFETLEKVNYRIAYLEEQERLERERLERERMNSETN